MKSLWIASVSLALFVSSCQCSDDQSGTAPFIPVEQAASEGALIADASQGALASALMKQINKDGFEGAVTFCHENALPLTDSLELIYNADIRRTSFRFRNAGNEPDSLDVVVLSEFERIHELDSVPQPKVVETTSGTLRYYSPIFVAPVCLNCHGMPGEDLTADLHALILEEYPQDEAVGFEVGDVRGSWVIEFAEAFNSNR
ncbi:Tll0287-like domain-containing protein [Phaeocystidibacter luteus]|uniref:DUF3365 domain-containing protein n=1 Tax=Phaeocystidibacter luteus TaxID=911197 RepID=A0A6N6RH90_9FLAO|nr:DUF3365 domain-containing protein [Phaeocystidibacter luteus]KAB2813739.1 DUF3365 domain-containing protein [Phaeocystidibacter luteus]